MTLTKEQLVDGISSLGEWIYETSKVSDETELTDENKHIKHYYKVLDELQERLAKEE